MLDGEQHTIMYAYARHRDVPMKTATQLLKMTVQSRGQVTLPKEMRTDMDLAPGDTVIAEPDGRGGYRLTRYEPLTIYEMYERWGDRTESRTEDVETMIQDAQEEEADVAVRRIEESRSARYERDRSCASE